MESTERFAMNLDVLRHTRLFMVENRDLDGLRNIAMHACTFAYFSIHQRVEQQEKYYAEYIAGSWVPRGLPAHKMPRYLPGMIEETLTDVRQFAGDDSTELARTIMQYPWLGSAKSTFACALMGYMDAPCIDVHMSRLIGVKCAPRDIDTYRAIARASIIPDTVSQWRAYMAVQPYYAHTQHDIYFGAVLGARANVLHAPRQLSLFA